MMNLNNSNFGIVNIKCKKNLSENLPLLRSPYLSIVVELSQFSDSMSEGAYFFFLYLLFSPRMNFKTVHFECLHIFLFTVYLLLFTDIISFEV